MDKLLKNTTVYSIGNIIPKVVSFLLLPIYTKYLSPQDYGIVQSMHIVSVFVAVIFSLSMERSIFRLYFDYNDYDEKKKFLGVIFVSLLGLSTIFIVLFLSFNSMLTIMFRSISFYPFYLYMLLATYINIFSIIPKIYFQIEHKVNKYIFFSLLEFFAGTLFILYFVMQGNGAEGMLFGKLLGAVVMLPLYLYVIPRIITINWNKAVFINSFKYSWPMVPGMVSAWILNLSDRFFIDRYFSMSDVGIYSLSYKLSEVLLLVTVAVNIAYEPIYFRVANEKKAGQDPKNTLYIYNSIIAIASIFIATMIVLFSREFISLIDSRYQYALTLAPVLIMGIVVNQVAELSNRSFYQEKKTKTIMTITIIGAGINIILNYILIPMYGSMGAAIATLLSFLIIFIIKYQYSKKLFFIKHDWFSIIFMGIIFAISVGVCTAITEVSIIVFAIKTSFLVIILLLCKKICYNRLLLAGKA